MRLSCPLLTSDLKVTRHRLRDFVIRIAGGATPSTKDAEIHYSESADGVTFIRVQNLSTTGKLNLDDCKKITRNTHEGLLSRSRLTGGELLVKITGVGRMAVASVVPEGFEGNINQHIVAIRTNDKKASETIAAYLNLDISERLASRRSTGGTRPALDYPALLSLPIVFDERIPELINAAVRRSEEKRAEANKLLSQIDEILLDELGIRPKPEPPNTIESRIFHTGFQALTGQRWDPLFHCGDVFLLVRDAKCDLQKLNDLIVKFQSGFAAGRSAQGEEENGIIQIRPTNISEDREIVFHRNIYIESSELSQRPFDRLTRKEVLFNNTNSQDQVGKTAYFDIDGDYFSSNHITRIVTSKTLLDPQYLYFILNLYQRRKVFFKLCTNWNNQSGVSVDVLKKIPIPVPKLKQQQEIIRQLEKIRTDANELRRKAILEIEDAKRAIETLILDKGSVS